MAKKKKTEVIEGQPVPPPSQKTGNVYINNLNVVIQPLREVIDPVAKVCYTPLLEHYDKRYRRHWDIHAHKILIIDLILLTLAAAGIVGGIAAYYLLPASSPHETVGTTIGSPSEVMSGALSDISVSWSNDTEKTLACAGLRIELPENAVLDGLVEGGASGDVCRPEPEKINGSLLVPLGDLGPNQRGTVILPVRLYGEPGERTVASSELIYWEEGQVLATRQAARIERVVTDSVLPLSIETKTAPERGQAVTFYLNLINASSEDLTGAEVVLEIPDDLVFYGADPAAAPDLTWPLPPLAPGEQETITVYGRLRGTGSPLGTTVVATAYLPDTNGTLQPVSGIRENLDPRAADLKLTVQPSGPGNLNFVRPGGTSEVTLRYANSGDAPMKNLRLHLDDGVMRLIAPLMSEDLAWDASSYPELSEVLPGQSGEITASISWRDDLYSLSDDISLTAFAEYETAGEKRSVLVESTPLQIGIIASLGLRAAASYYTVGGDQLGLGPLPPVVGETTSYWVFLEASALGGTIQELVAKATLTENAHWTGRTSALAGSAPDFDPLSREVSWRVGSLKTDQPAIVGFEVALTPTPDQVNSAAVILQAVQIKGRDLRSGVTLKAETTDVDTNLNNRAGGTDFGKVLPKP